MGVDDAGIVTLTRRDLVTSTRMNQISRLDPSLGSHNLSLYSECCGVGLTESSARDQMTSHIELDVDDVVDRQKPLHRSGRFEPFHPAFSSVRWLARRLM